jgi:CBS domain containing-hemolysin-like protein
MWTAFNLSLIVLLVLANGFFVASEFALVGVRRSRVATLAAKGDPRAQRVLRLIDNLNAYISATQLGITLASLALGWIGEPAVAHLLEAPLRGMVSEAVLETISFTVAFAFITFLHIVIGELAPKTLALELAEKTAFAIAWPMETFYSVFRWPIRLLDWAGTRAVRLFGLHPTTEHGAIYTEEELRHLIDASRQGGYLADEKQRLIHRVFDFAGGDVRVAMVPRTAMDAIPLTASLEDVKKAFRSLGYSRLPVYREVLDNIVGVVFRRDLEPYLERPEGFDLKELLHQPLYVPPTAQLSAVLKRMQSARTHLAFVIDEHGGLEGLVTLEDLLEEIVGEIEDEFDEEVRAQIISDNGAYLLDGMLSVRAANRRLGLKLPEDTGYTTLAGFLLDKFGRIPQQGETIEHDGAVFKIERVDRRRIRRVRFIPSTNENKSSTASLVSLVWASLVWVVV